MLVLLKRYKGTVNTLLLHISANKLLDAMLFYGNQTQLLNLFNDICVIHTYQTYQTCNENFSQYKIGSNLSF